MLWFKIIMLMVCYLIWAGFMAIMIRRYDERADKDTQLKYNRRAEGDWSGCSVRSDYIFDSVTGCKRIERGGTIWWKLKHAAIVITGTTLISSAIAVISCLW